MRRNTNRRLLPVVILGFVVAEQGSTQTTAADGPWAGWAQCQLTAQGQGYANQQTHTWVLTGTTPTVEGAFRLYPATWTVTGQGSRQRVMGDGRTVVEQWTTAGPPRPAPISVWIRGSDATLRFTSRSDKLARKGAATGTSTARSTKSNAPAQTTLIGYEVGEWTFPAIEGVPATATTVNGSLGPRLVYGSIAPGQPPGTSLTEACSWRFDQTTVLASAPPPPGGPGALPTVSPSTPISGAALPTTGGFTAAPPSPGAPAPVPTPATGSLPTVSPGSRISGAPLPTTTSDPTRLTAWTPPSGPAPAGVAVTGIGVSANVSWQAAAGAASYTVTRWAQSDPNCCTASSSSLTATSWNDTGLQWPGTYVYRVTASYPDGRAGSTDVVFTRPTPQDPSGFTATQTGEAEVKLTWQLVPGVSTYLVGGPGAGPSGATITGNTATMTGVPSGTQQWSVASVYSPGGLLTPGANWPRASLTIPVVFNTYRVVLERFQVDKPTAEDPLISDGRGDEIYITTQVNLFQSNGLLQNLGMVTTPVFGDALNFPGRIMAGSAGPTGGLVKGDGYPPPTSQLQPPTTTRLPFTVWEGNLSNVGDWIAFSPAIWEQDGGDRVLRGFAQYYQTTAVTMGMSQFVQKYRDYGTWVICPGGSEACTRVFRWCGDAGADWLAPGGIGPVDVPVEMDEVTNTWCPPWVALNRKAFNSLLPDGQPRIFGIAYWIGMLRNPDRRYVLYLRLEKIR